MLNKNKNKTFNSQELQQKKGKETLRQELHS